MTLHVHAHLVLGGVTLMPVELAHKAAVLVHAVEELVLGLLIVLAAHLFVVRACDARELHEVAPLCDVHVGVEAAVFGEVRPV